MIVLASLTWHVSPSEHFNETLNGLTTIRAFGSGDRFLESNRTHIDLNARTLKSADTAIRWFAMRLQLCSACIVFTTTLFITLNVGNLPSVRRTRNGAFGRGTFARLSNVRATTGHGWPGPVLRADEHAGAARRDPNLHAA